MEKKKNQLLFCILLIFFLYGGFKFSKINFWFTFRKNCWVVTQREKKVRSASTVIKAIFFFSLLLFFFRIKTMIHVIIIFDPVIETREL